MKVTMRAKVLADAARRMDMVASKGFDPQFRFGMQTTILVSPDDVVFTATNGSMDVSLKLTDNSDPHIGDNLPGVVTVDSQSLLAAATSIVGRGFGDHPVCLREENKRLLVCDSRGGSSATLEMLEHNHELSICRPSGQVYRLPSEVWIEGIHSVARYANPTNWKLRYKLVHVHWRPGQIRFVCGTGTLFAISSHQIDDSRETILNIPAALANIIARVLSEEQSMEIVVAPTLSEGIYICAGDTLKMVLRLSREIKYISYYKHAYRTAEAPVVIEVEQQALRDAVNHIRPNQNNRKDELNAHSVVTLNAWSDTLELVASDDEHGVRQITVPARLYSIDGSDQFSGTYSSQHVIDLSRVRHGRRIRFYPVNEGKTMIADVVRPEDFSSGLPGQEASPESNASSLRFFFAGATRS